MTDPSHFGPEARNHAGQLVFGDYALDFDAHELRCGGLLVNLSGKCLALLMLLARNAERVVEKQELLDTLWPGVAVGEDSVSQAVRQVRVAVRDDGSRQSVIRTVRGIGYRFVALHEEPAEARSSPSLDAPPRPSGSRALALVGRAAERGRLAAALGAAEAGTGRALLLTGEAGIGKTSLVRELAAQASVQGGTVSEGSANESGGAPMLWPWLPAVRHGIAQSSVDDPASRRRIALARGLLPESPSDAVWEPDGDSERIRFALLDAVVGLLSASQRPHVVLLEDLHWADPESIVLFRMLARVADRHPLLIVATMRTDERLAPEREVPLTKLATEPSIEHLSLGGLAEAEVAELLALEWGDAPSGRVVKTVRARTASNPFFVVQLARQVEPQRGAEDEAHFVERLHGETPRAFGAAMERRLAVLSGPARSVLRAAAVAGSTASMAVLRRTQELVEWEPGELIEALDECVEANLLEEVPGELATYRFPHALIRSAIVEGLPAVELARLHGQLATAVERTHGDDLDRHLPSLAEHSFAAAAIEDPERAVNYCERAGHRAAASLAYDEAARFFGMARKAAETCDSLTPRRIAEIWVGLADALGGAGRADDGVEAWARACCLARALGEPAFFARQVLAAARHDFRWGREASHAILLVEEALAWLPESDESIRVLLMSQLAVLGMVKPRSYPDAVRLADRAVAIASELDDDTTLVDALAVQVHFIRGSRTPSVEARLDVFAAAARACVGMSDTEDAAVGVHRIGLELERGDPAAAWKVANRYASAAKRGRLPLWIYNEAAYEGVKHLLAGRFQEAEAIARSGLDRVVTPLSNEAALYVGLLLLALREQDRLAEAVSLIPRTVNLLPGYRPLEAWAHALLGEEAACRRIFEELARGDFADVTASYDWRVSVAALGHCCVALGDGDRAPILAELLEPFSPYAIVAGNGLIILEPAALVLGELATLADDFNRAEAYFSQSAELAQRMAWRPALARTQASHARLCLKRRARGDRIRARALLAKASTAANELGMAQLWREAAAIQDEAAGL